MCEALFVKREAYLGEMRKSEKGNKSNNRRSGIAFLRHSGLDPESRKDRLDTGVRRYDEHEELGMTKEIY